MHCLVGSVAVLARPQQTGHRRGRAVGQEQRNRQDGADDLGRQAESAELSRTDIADHGGIGKDIEGLGDQSAQRRYRQREHLAIGSG